jgi:hypothetical protein
LKIQGSSGSGRTRCPTPPGPVAGDGNR